MSKLFPVSQYLHYLIKARDEHSLHSPFAFEFYTKVIKGSGLSFNSEQTESLRKALKQNHTEIEITDFGAGSGINGSKKRSISSICKHSEKRAPLAQLIARIINYQQPTTIFDLGTSLGLTTLYEAQAAPSARVYTFEGCPNTAAVAADNFKTLAAENIHLIVGNIDTTLQETLAKISTLDVAFFDANHRYKPTLNYFNLCLEKATEDSIFIFDDIYWSAEMKQAWNDIKKHSSVTMTMDLFYIGIVFFRKKQPVQHFTLK